MKRTISLAALTILAALSLSAYAQAPGAGPGAGPGAPKAAAPAPAKTEESSPSKKPASPKKAAVKAEIKASTPAPATSAPVLGKAKEECVYRPVMTNQDMENCGVILGSPRRL